MSNYFLTKLMRDYCEEHHEGMGGVQIFRRHLQTIVAERYTHFREIGHSGVEQFRIFCDYQFPLRELIYKK